MAASRRKKRPSDKAPAYRWPLLVGMLVVVVVVGVSALVWSRTDRGQAALLHLGADALFGEVQARVDSVLVDHWPQYVPGPVGPSSESDAHDWPLAGQGPTAAIHCRLVPVGDPGAWWQIQADLDRALQEVGARVLWGERMARPRGRSAAGATPDEPLDILRLDLGVTGRATHTLLLYRDDTERPRARWGGDPASTAWRRLAARADAPLVAIVIDDWGYRSDATTGGLIDLEQPLTMAVLPGLAYSRRFALEATDLVLPVDGGDPPTEQAVARRLAAGTPVTVGLGADPTNVPARRREVILHLPMESVRYPDVDPGPHAVLVGMSGEEIAAVVGQALASLPNVRGVNNHQGSAATADQPTMAALMQVLRERDLFFLDSLTSSQSVAFAEAEAAGLAAARNRVFLDNDHNDPASIRERLQRLVQAARATGAAVGIGHPHPATLAVLRAEMPRLAADGVVFVTMSELLALRPDEG